MTSFPVWYLCRCGHDLTEHSKLQGPCENTFVIHDSVTLCGCERYRFLHTVTTLGGAQAMDSRD